MATKLSREDQTYMLFLLILGAIHREYKKVIGLKAGPLDQNHTVTVIDPFDEYLEEFSLNMFFVRARLKSTRTASWI